MARHVDHLAIAIHDLESASSTLETAGFVVTPRADHPFGTSNRLVVFVDTYLELVAVTRAELIPEAGFAAEVAAFIASGEGISHAVVSSEDPIADHAFLADRGLANGDIFEFSRPAPRADGSVTTASFSIVPALSTGSIGAFLCAHHVPDAVWHPSHLAHPNGASRITGLELPGPVPEVFEVFAVAGVEFGDGPARVVTDGGGDRVEIGGLVVG